MLIINSILFVQNGIKYGLQSLLSTWILITLISLCYAACGCTFFRHNDPFHFGTFSISMWTLFSISTLDVRIYH